MIEPVHIGLLQAYTVLMTPARVWKFCSEVRRWKRGWSYHLRGKLHGERNTVWA